MNLDPANELESIFDKLIQSSEAKKGARVVFCLPLEQGGTQI